MDIREHAAKMGMVVWLVAYSVNRQQIILVSIFNGSIIKVMLCVSCTACQCMCGIETRSELILYPAHNTKKSAQPHKAKNLNKLLNTYSLNNNSSKLMNTTQVIGSPTQICSYLNSPLGQNKENESVNVKMGNSGFEGVFCLKKLKSSRPSSFYVSPLLSPSTNSGIQRDSQNLREELERLKKEQMKLRSYRQNLKEMHNNEIRIVNKKGSEMEGRSRQRKKQLKQLQEMLSIVRKPSSL